MATLFYNAGERAEILAEAERDVSGILAKISEEHRDASCVFWAAAVTGALVRRGRPALFQAGSASWPRLHPWQDDGAETTLTHFSYVWDAENARGRILRAMLPEMHCWCAVKGDDPEIIDPLSGAQPERARKLGGMDWPGPRPPNHMWCLVSKMPARTYYHPNIQAIRAALEFLKHALKGGPLVVTLPE